MSIFWIVAAAFVGLAFLFLLPALLRKRSPTTVSDAVREANLPLLKEQLKLLDTDVAAGSLSVEQRREARAELERRVLEETAADDRHVVAEPARYTAIALALGVPLLAVGLYVLLGNPRGLAPMQAAAANDSAGEVSTQQVEGMVAKLAKHMEDEPGDAKGWAMLARSYAMLQRFAQASHAYAQAINLTPEDAQLLVDHAGVLAALQEQGLAGEPTQLIDQALRLEPNNVKALALAGSAAFEREDYAAAVGYWSKALELAPPGTELEAGLERGLSQARAAASVSTSLTVKKLDKAAGFIAGRVSVVPALATRVAPTDTVFIFARATKGPRMPLAVSRHSGADLPISFTLDDSSAMSAQLKLSNFDSVVVTARVSKTGNAMPQAGDLQGQSGPIKIGRRDIEVSINSIQP